MSKKRIITHRQLARHNGWHHEYSEPIDHDPIDAAAWIVIAICVIVFIVAF